MCAYTYIVECSDGTLYTGWTVDIEKRLLAHNKKRGAKYTKPRLPVHLVYLEALPTSQCAMQREYAIKRLTRKGKELLIEGQRNFDQQKRKSSEIYG